LHFQYEFPSNLFVLASLLPSLRRLVRMILLQHPTLDLKRTGHLLPERKLSRMNIFGRESDFPSE